MIPIEDGLLPLYYIWRAFGLTDSYVAIVVTEIGYQLPDVALVPGAPPNMASRIAKKCIEKGMLILTTSVYEVIRFIPPLNVSEADLKKGYNIFAEAVREVVREG